MSWGKKGLYAFIAFVLTVLTFRPSAGALVSKFNMTYIYFGDSSKYPQLVEAARDSLDEVAPAYFSLDDSGNLVHTPAVSEDFVQIMHDKGISVVPYITNDWNYDRGRAALCNREALSDQIVEAIFAYDLDGVNIDIENMTPDERDIYVDFIRLLRSKLPKDKIIAVAVAANPWGTSKGWAGSYDYARLAEYSNYLMIMAYDESYRGSDPGPVASISFVERSVKYALSVVPKDKIVLGLPFYGRIWGSDGGYPYGYGISNERVETLIRNYNGTVVFDEQRKSACAKITIKESDPKPLVNGTALPAGTYDIWFHDERSIKAGLELVTKYDIRGTGSWSLGQEADGTWDYYRFWLNGCTFLDIQDSWARDYIYTAYINGWMNGVSSEGFSPDTSLTRAQAAALLIRMLGLTAEADGAYRFSDSGGHWAEAYIDTARKHGIVSGVGDNRFEPDRPITREETAVLFSNVLNLSGEAGPASFPDVTEEENPWSYEAISRLSAEEIITGYPDGSFRPKGQITRAEISAMISRIDTTRFNFE